MRDCIGILGGMGPLATVDLMSKIIAATPAACDQDHIPLVVYSVPQIPDRLTALERSDDAPWPHLLDGLRALERAGAQAIVMPCNTAHYWHARLQAHTVLPLLHIADAACDEIRSRCAPPCTIGLLATTGTIGQGFYQQRLQAHGYAVALPDALQQAVITRAIREVKAGDLPRARALLEPVCDALRLAGCRHLLLACTELPLALAGAPLDTVAIDATAALARSAVAWSLAARRRSPGDSATKSMDGHQVAGGFS